jgi:hypothetical protein
MRIVMDEKMVSRNQKIARYTMIASLAILVIGLIISFTNPEQIIISFGALLLGFLMSQIALFYGNRWGKSPRPDEILNDELKGLDERYILYHYCTPVPHLLVGPAGIWVLAPYSQAGKIEYDANKDRWTQQGGNWYLKVFGQEGLGRPERDAKITLQDIHKYLHDLVGDDPRLPQAQIALIFTNDKAEIQSQEAPLAAMPVSKLKDFIRRKAKEVNFSADAQTWLEEELP